MTTAKQKEASYRPSESLAWASHNDATVNRMMYAWEPLERIVEVLAKEKAELFKRIMELESIVPRKIKLPNGDTAIWHCPDRLIPESLT